MAEYKVFVCDCCRWAWFNDDRSGCFGSCGSKHGDDIGKFPGYPAGGVLFVEDGPGYYMGVRCDGCGSYGGLEVYSGTYLA